MVTSAPVVKSAIPSVSVIVTTSNRVELLSETVDSILAQSYTDFELIIVDNMSEDGTREYVIGLENPRINYFRNPNNGVIAVNRNFGIQQAQGRYIALCDDDDLWLPDKLKQQVTLMEIHPDVALCYSNAESFEGSRVIKRRRIRRCVRRNHFSQLLRGNYIPNSSVLIRTQVFKALGLLTTDPALREDYHMWLRIANEYQLVGLDESLIRYRIHPNNAARNRTTETLRSIRTVRSIIKLLDIPWLPVQPHIGFQFLKYCIYSILKS